ncbi:phage tail protein [Rahnella sp. CJA17(1/100)]|nr:phage tail protein [Rahnella sp. CJA17(1/100)]
MRWHVLQRSGKSRYPIEVVKIPLGGVRYVPASG